MVGTVYEEARLERKVVGPFRKDSDHAFTKYYAAIVTRITKGAHWSHKK